MFLMLPQFDIKGSDAVRTPEPKGRLDAMTGYSSTTSVWEGGKWVVPAETNAVEPSQQSGQRAAVTQPNTGRRIARTDGRSRLLPRAGQKNRQTADAIGGLFRGHYRQENCRGIRGVVVDSLLCRAEGCRCRQRFSGSGVACVAGVSAAGDLKPDPVAGMELV